MSDIVTAKLNVVLHENQQKVADSPARFKVIKAGKRFGKSWFAMYIILRWAGKKKNGKFWYIAPTYGNAKDIAWDVIKWMLPPEMVERYYESDLTVLLKSGSKVVLKGADKPETLRGPGLDGVVMDERAYQDEDLWNRVIRGQLASSLGPAVFISSPNKVGRNHFSNFWDEAKKKMDAGDPEWAAFYYTIYDNPTLSRKEIEDMKEGMPESTWELEYMAKESAISGILYSEFAWANNVGEYLGDKNLNHYRGLDWGIDHPTACLWASLDLETKILYISDEYVKSGNVIKENALVINNKSSGRSFEWTVCDPSMNRRDHRDNNVTDMTEFARWGIPCISGDNRARGYDIVKMFLKFGRLKISPKCKTLLYEIQNVQWGDKEGEDCLDVLRYICTRINDYVWGMNVFNEMAQEDIPKRGELNLNNPFIFEDIVRKQPNWVEQEISEVA